MYPNKMRSRAQKTGWDNCINAVYRFAASGFDPLCVLRVRFSKKNVFATTIITVGISTTS